MSEKKKLEWEECFPILTKTDPGAYTSAGLRQLIESLRPLKNKIRKTRLEIEKERRLAFAVCTKVAQVELRFLRAREQELVEVIPIQWLRALVRALAASDSRGPSP